MALPAPVTLSPVAAQAGTLAARFPAVHRLDARVAMACHGRQQAAVDSLAEAADKRPGNAQHVIAKAGANLASGLAAAQAYRLVGAQRDRWLGLTSPANLPPPAPPKLSVDEHLTNRLLHRLITGQPAPAPPAPVAASVKQGLARAGHGAAHAAQLSLAVGASGIGMAAAVPTGAGAYVLAYTFCRLALHLQSDAENEALLQLLHYFARTLELPISQRLWLMVHKPAV